MSLRRCASSSSGPSGPSVICRKCRTMPFTSSTSVPVDGSCPRRCARSGSASHSSARISAYSAAFEGKCLNSKPSEIEAAAATLLVVVPAKPLRAKQRFAALRINSRRKSLVMRNVLMVVSKHSLGQMSTKMLRRSSNIYRRHPEELRSCAASRKMAAGALGPSFEARREERRAPQDDGGYAGSCVSNRLITQGPTDTRDDVRPVAIGQHALQVGIVDFDAGETRTAGDVLHQRCEGFDLGHGRDGAGVGDAAAAGDADEVGSGGGVARLPAGF